MHLAVRRVEKLEVPSDRYRLHRLILLLKTGSSILRFPKRRSNVPEGVAILGEFRSLVGPRGKTIVEPETREETSTTTTTTVTGFEAGAAAFRERLVLYGALLTPIGRSYGVSHMR